MEHNPMKCSSDQASENQTVSSLEPVSEVDNFSDITNDNIIEAPFIKLTGAPFSLFDIEELDMNTDFTHKFTNRHAAYYGTYNYFYSGTTHYAREVSENSYLCKILSYLEIVLPSFKYNSALINKYEDNESFMPPHGDTENEIVSGSDIVTISLGETRSILFTSKSEETVGETEIAHGEVFVMSQSTQKMFSHTIPKENNKCGARLSITLRMLKPENTINSETGFAPVIQHVTQHSNTAPVITQKISVEPNTTEQKTATHHRGGYSKVCGQN